MTTHNDAPGETLSAPDTAARETAAPTLPVHAPTGERGNWTPWMPTGIGVASVLLALAFLPVPAPLSVDETAEVAVAYYKLKAPQAGPAFEKALKLDPGHRRANFAAGLAAIDAGRPQQAEAYLKKALERSPGDQEIELSLAALYQTMGRVEEAKALYKALAARFPQDARIAYNQALLALKQDDKPEALRLFERYLALPTGRKKRASVERTVAALKKQIDGKTSATKSPAAASVAPR